MSTTDGQKRLRGCETCRERHIKCDRGNPCSYCAKTGRRCVRPIKWRFRHSCVPSIDGYEFEFPGEQKWCMFSGKRFTFIDETVETYANYGEHVSGFHAELSEPLSSMRISLDQGQTIPDSVPSLLNKNSSNIYDPDVEHGTDGAGLFLQSPSFLDQRHGIVSLTNRSSSSPEYEYSTLQRSSIPDFDTQVDDGVNSAASCFGECKPSSAQTPVFPLSDFSEAKSIRYYIDHVAPIFDLYDKQFNFSTSVPEAAGSSPTLMSIISTLATEHRESFRYNRLSLVSTKRSWCSKCLRRVLATYGRMLDGDVLSSIVLLRFLAVIRTALGVKGEEEYESTEIGHVLDSQAQFLLPTGLHQAAFWAGVRQEIYLAVLHQRSTPLRLDKGNIDRSLEDAKDETWMGRITLHLVDVLEFCFGPTKVDPHAIREYESLVGYLTAWASSKPESFEPLFTQLPEDGENFPEIVFLTDCAMEAWHCYHLSRMLLIAHNPRVPRIGSTYMTALQSIDNEIKSDVQTLCGIAEASGNAYRACPAAIMGIVLAGDRFTDLREQQALLDFLVKVEKNRAWPTWSIQQQMKETWGWSPS
ncbi:hypothetical protein F5Y09DRAFT_324826 [Xylaria sp. FL1042]|nr:hypothetical protein F5Y09DRAFT_324826 [Xylaria sp. FL1042]